MKIVRELSIDKGCTYSLSFLAHSSFMLVELKVATTFVVGHPITNDFSEEGFVVSQTSPIHVAVHISHTRILCFSLNVVLDLKVAQVRVRPQYY